MELLERDEALCGLEAALQAALLGQGCVVLISGEAGIGKTWLVRDFVRHGADTWLVLWGA